MKNYLIGIGEYLKEDYEEILKISEDRDNLDHTWKDWKKNKENSKKQLIEQGLNLVDIIVRPAELVKYCRDRGLKITGKTRSQFISFKTQELDKK